MADGETLISPGPPRITDEGFAIDDQSPSALSAVLPPRIAVPWGRLALHAQTPRGRDIFLIVGNKADE